MLANARKPIRYPYLFSARTIPYAIGGIRSPEYFQYRSQGDTTMVPRTLPSRFQEYEQNVTRISFLHQTTWVFNIQKEAKKELNWITATKLQVMKVRLTNAHAKYQ